MGEFGQHLESVIRLNQVSDLILAGTQLDIDI